MSNKTRQTLFVCALLVIVTSLSLSVIYSTEPTAQKEGATKKTAMLVNAMVAEIADYRPRIKTFGVVVPAQEIELKSRVAGEVVSMSDQFVPGNFIAKGEWLIQLDKADYDLAFARAEAFYAKAQAAYEIEMGEQLRAKRAFELVKDTVDNENKALVLRQPQKRQAEADLITARAAMQQAKLELERTLIKMPFDGQILSRNANLGSRISTNDMLAKIVGTDTYWVESSLSLAQLPWLAQDGLSDLVSIRNKTALQAGEPIQGRLIQVISTLDEDSRMARVLIEVNDPLGLNGQDNGISPQALIAGTYVETDLPARIIINSVKLPVQFLRKRNTVWVDADGKLDIRQVQVAFKDDTHAYITEGLQGGDRIITSDISRVRQGALVQSKTDSEIVGIN